LDTKLLGKCISKVSKISCKVKKSATPINPVQFADCDSEELTQPTEELHNKIVVIRGKIASVTVHKVVVSNTPSNHGPQGRQYTSHGSPHCPGFVRHHHTIVPGQLSLLGGSIDKNGKFTMVTITPALQATLRHSEKKRKVASFYSTLMNPIATSPSTMYQPSLVSSMTGSPACPPTTSPPSEGS
jgi:hypothetical protein